MLLLLYYCPTWWIEQPHYIKCTFIRCVSSFCLHDFIYSEERGTSGLWLIMYLDIIKKTTIKKKNKKTMCLSGRVLDAAGEPSFQIKREIGVSIKSGRHRRGCFLLVKVYRKSGDGVALSPVAPHHKSHFPLFKLWKFSLVNLSRFAIGNFELHAFISEPTLVKSSFLLSTFFFCFTSLLDWILDDAYYYCIL